MDDPKLPPSLNGFVGGRKLIRRGVNGEVGGWGGPGQSRDGDVTVLKEVHTFGAPKIQTRVTWKRPSDGTDVVMICDVYGLIRETGLGNKPTVNPIYTVHAMCPKCGPNDENGSQFEIPSGIKIELDEQGLLWLEGGRAVIRCPYLCGWVVRIEAGRAHDVSAALYSKISWNY